MSGPLIDTRSVWLNEEVGLSERPNNCSARLFGTYDDETHITTISLIISCDGTDYRTVRYHREVNTFKTNDEERLRYLHRNMITYFMRDYKNAAFATVVEKFLKWSKNRIYHKVLAGYVR